MAKKKLVATKKKPRVAKKKPVVAKKKPGKKKPAAKKKPFTKKKAATETSVAKTGGERRERFLQLCEVDDPKRSYIRHRTGRVDIYLPGVYRMFASWIDGGPQPGPHLRSDAEEGPRSEAFRGNHNWLHCADLPEAKLPAAIAESRRISAMRGAGWSDSGTLPDVYKPLLKALKQLQNPPTDLHAGGPRAKVLSGEQQLAASLCRRCIARMQHRTHPGDEEILARLNKLADQGYVKYDILHLAANALPYGTDRAKTEADAAESAAVQTTRALLGCNYGSQKCIPFVTKALVRTIGELAEVEGAEAASTFAIELDELIMEEEFRAAMVARAKVDSPKFQKVLWRGADAKGYPAWWLVRVDSGSYGLLGKLGRKWSWQVADWDSVVAMVPDEHFERAAQVACGRDGRS